MLVLEQVFPAATQPGKVCANNYTIAIPSHILYIVSQYEKHMVFKVFEGSYSVLGLQGAFWLGSKYLPRKNGNRCRTLLCHETFFSSLQLSSLSLGYHQKERS
jgi:hypothetical protein